MREPTLPRRAFLKHAWQGMTALVAASMGYIGWRFLDSRPSDHLVGKLITITNPSTLMPESVTPFPEGQFYLIRTTDGGFLALSRQCTHLACMVLWQAEHFRCPCHGSEFEINGSVLNAPASDPLWRYAIAVDGNRLVVDTQRKLKRSDHLSDDLVYMTEDRT